MRTEQDSVLAGRYRLIRSVGDGGMGSVWEAKDQQLDRRVAIKIPDERLAQDPEFVERFRREARSVAKLSHPHIAQVFDYGVDRGRPYLVMELVDGETLADRLNGDGPLPADQARAVAMGVAEALRVAHEAGIVHRDVKPGNIMLTPAGGVKVLDFGVAAGATEARMTTSGVIMGTPAYIAPERAQGKPATPASDVYSLGVVLYEMLAGRPPYSGDTAVAVASAHVHGEPEPLSRAVRGVDPDLARASEAAMQKDPARRPGSARQFAALLGGATMAMPAPSSPSSTGASTQVLPRDRTEVLPVAAPPGEATGAEATPPTGLEPPPPPGRRRAWIIAAAVVAALVLAVLAFLVLVNLSSHQPGPAVSTPPPATSPATSPAASRTRPSTPSPSPSPSPSSPPPTTTAPPTTAPATSLPTTSLSVSP